MSRNVAHEAVCSTTSVDKTVGPQQPLSVHVAYEALCRVITGDQTVEPDVPRTG